MARWFVDRSAQRGIPSVSLRRLLPEARFLGCKDLHVTGCSTDSRRLDPGQVFVALRGGRRDGHDYAAAALDRGATAVIVERPCPEAGSLQVVVPDSRLALGRLAQALAGDPSAALEVVGVAGTAGKTAAGLFARAIFEAAGRRMGMVEPFHWSDGVDTHSCGPNPAESPGLAAMLAEMVERRCEGAIVEVADSTLDRRGIEGMGFTSAVVTGLGGVPGEPPADRTRRRARTSRLARAVAPGGAVVVNADDSESDLMGAVNLAARRVSFGLVEPADVAARIDRLDGSGTRFRLLGFDREAAVRLRPVGTRAVSHALAAAALAWAHGLPVAAVVAGLESVAAVPGRLESVAEADAHGLDVRVDRARTAAELLDALAALRELGTGRIHCVLGAEGLGDRPARIALARAAELGADQLTLTTDNPRTEDPDQILDDLLAGLVRPGRARVEPDRRAAIESALAMAEPGDLALIAGKGRLAFQILTDRALPFDDHAVAARYLRELRPPVRRRSA